MEPQIVDRTHWLRERMALLKREKGVTRELDALARARQSLPWVELERDYTLITEAGPTPLIELFKSHRQLIVYHFMFGPGWRSLCDGCSEWAAAFNGTIEAIERYDATLIAVSRAPIEALVEAKARNHWSFVWASSSESPFNEDFHMSAPVNQTSAMVGDEEVFYDRGESGGINVFARKGETIYHTYSCHNRGIQQMNGTFGYVDLLPFGGN